MRSVVAILFIFCAGFALTGCLATDIADGVAKMTESPEKRLARLKREEAARLQQQENIRRAEIRRKEKEAETVRLLVESFRKICLDYGYQAGTPDFKQCVGNEIRGWEQKQNLLAMEEAAQRRAAAAINREEAAEKKRKNAEAWRDLEAAREQRRRDTADSFDMNDKNLN